MRLVRGSVRLITATCPQHAFTATELQPTNLAEWRASRQQLTQRQAARALQRRFRQDPAAYLADAERLLHPESLPPWKKGARCSSDRAPSCARGRQAAPGALDGYKLQSPGDQADRRDRRGT
jgi:hypothetical protein